MFLSFTMARLSDLEAGDWIAGFTRAFRDALDDDKLSFKAACLLMKLDEGQAERGLAGLQAFDVRRLGGLALQRPTFAGHLLKHLCIQWGGVEEVMAHGLLRLISGLCLVAGQARMARVAFPDPRKEGRECVAGSLRVSA